MPPGWAKLIVLPIIERWSLETKWCVCWPLDDALAECRWFSNEERARQYSATVRGSLVQKTTFDRFDTSIARPVTEEEHEAIRAAQQAVGPVRCTPVVVRE